MKTTLFILPVFIISLTVNAQYNPVASMVTNFKEIAAVKRNSPQLGSMGIQTYSGEIKGSQFFYPVFADGSATTIKNEVFANIYFFLLDKVKQELYIIKKDDKRTPPDILLVDKTQLKYFSITTDKDHNFVPARFYEPANTTDFYEILKENDSAYTLLKSVKTEFVKANNRDYETVRTNKLTDEFVDKVTYYLSYKTGKPQPVKLSERNILHAFPQSQTEMIQAFFESHGQDDLDEDLLVSLVGVINK